MKKSRSALTHIFSFPSSRLGTPVFEAPCHVDLSRLRTREQYPSSRPAAHGQTIVLGTSLAASPSQPATAFVSDEASPRGMSCEKNDTPPKTLPWTDKFCQIVRKLDARRPRTWSTGIYKVFPKQTE
jgi:hypothetical protein